MTTLQATIETHGLGRQFAGKWAVRNLDLRVMPGEIYGFLGQNGAGKTTTIRMLAGLLQPSEGQLSLLGRDYGGDPRPLKQMIGLVPDTPPLYDYLTSRQYVALVASLWHVPRRERDERCDRLFHLLSLDDVADDLCKGHSHGTRKKVHIAAVLTTAPQVLLLDEPTTGLDPMSTRRLKELLQQESQRGTTILFSTHVLETAEQICHRVGILAGGTLRAEGTVAELRSRHAEASLEDVFFHATTGDSVAGAAPENGDGPAVR
jgi:ABC-2 type transport system ATP-binding protein